MVYGIETLKQTETNVTKELMNKKIRDGILPTKPTNTTKICSFPNEIDVQPIDPCLSKNTKKE